MKSETYDLSYLEELSLGNDAILKELIDLFIEGSDEFFKNIKEAYRAENWQAFHKAVHSYSSQIGMLKPKAPILNKIEFLYNFDSKQNKKEKISVIVAELEIEIKKIIISLTSDFA